MNDSCENILIKALALMQAGNLTEAEPLLKEIITSNKNFHEAFHLLGMIYATREDFVKASECFKEALRINPENAVYNSNYANSLQDTWLIEESFEYYFKAIKLDPNFVDAYYNLGNAYRKCQRTEDAVKNYETTLRLNPRYIKAYVSLSACYESNKDYNRAINILQDALKIDPHSFESLTAMAVIFAAKKDYAQAMGFFKLAYETGRVDDKFYLNYGTACQDMNNPAEAAVAFLKAAAIAPSKHASLGRALHQKMLIADWTNTTQLNEEIVQRLHFKEDVVDPFGYMGFSDSERDLQLAAKFT
jgi:tetratricopeptide (TPR) repeat protein